MKDKLAECNIAVDLSQKILDNVFGKKLGSVFVEGIVDASDDRTSLVLLHRPGTAAACQAQSTWKGSLTISWRVKLP